MFPKFIEEVGQIAGVEISILDSLLKKMDASPGCEALDVAVRRFMGIASWCDEAINLEILKPDELQNLIRLDETRDSWSKALPPDAPTRSNSPVKSIGDYPLYSLLTVQVGTGGETLESILMPAMATYYLLYALQEKSASFYQNASAKLRKFYSFGHTETKKLLKLTSHEKWDGKRRSLYLLCRTYKDLDWLRNAEELLNQEMPRFFSSKASVHPANLTKRHTRPRQFNHNKIKSFAIDLSWTSDDIDLEGLSPNESGLKEELLTFNSDDEVEPVLAYRRFHSFTEMENQHLPEVWRHLRKEEVIWLGQELEQLIKDDSKLALVIALSLATSRAVEDVFRFLVTNENLDAKHEYHDITIFINDGVWVHPKYQPEQAYSPKNEELPFLQKTSNCVFLAFPNKLREWLSAHLTTEQNMTVGNLLGQEGELINRAETWVKNIRKRSTYSRFTLARIRDWAAYETLSSTKDPALVSQIYWFDSSSSASVYYPTFESQQLQFEYSSVMSTCFGETFPCMSLDYLVGSELRLKTDFIPKLVKRLKSGIEIAKTSPLGIERCIKVHNAITNYVLTMLLIETGHRPVSDLFERCDGLDEEAKIYIIADKIGGDRDAARIVWLSDNAIEQIQTYKKHLKVLTSYILEFDVELAKRIQMVADGGQDGRLPLFFYLNRKKGHPPRPQKITPKLFKQALEMELPLNCFRHHLSTALRKINVPAEFVHYQLDHMKLGQEFYGRYSTISVLEISRTLSPALKQLSNDVGFTLERGLARSKSRPRKSKRNHEQVFWRLGSEERAFRRQEHNRKLRQIIKDSISEVDQPFNQQSLEIIDSRLREKLSNDAVLLRAKRLIYRAYRNQHDEMDELFRKCWEISLPLKRFRNPISLTHGKELKLAKSTREKTYQWVMTARVDTPYEELFSMFIVSSITNGGLLSLEKVEFLLSNFDRCKRLGALVWLDFEEKRYEPASIKRWFLEPITTKLLDLMLTSEVEPKIPPKRKINSVIKVKLGLAGIEKLIELSVCLADIEMPPVLKYYATDDLVSASVKESNLIRMISGRPMLDGNKLEKERKSRTYEIGKPTIANEAIYQVNVDYRKAVKQIITCSKLDRNQRAAELKTLNDQYEKIVSPLCIAYVEWLIQLFENEYLKPSSIGTYQANSAKCLFEACWSTRDISDFNETDFQVLYVEALSYVKDSNQPTVANYLGRFHSSLVKSWKVSRLDFTEIEPRVMGVSVRPELYTEADYQNFCSSIPPQLHFVPAFFYRSRMRLSEVKKLDLKDIHCDEKNITIDVRSTAGKPTKTKSGIRCFPFSSFATEYENQQVSNCVKGQGKGRIEDLVPEISFEKIRDGLKLATSDAKATIHGMRHSAVSFALLELLQANDYHISKIVDSQLPPTQTEKDETFRSQLYREALLTGHSSPLTTLTSYTHTLDLALFSRVTSQISFEWGVHESEYFGVETNRLNYLKRKNPTDYLFKLQKEVLANSAIPNLAESISFVEPVLVEEAKTKTLDLLKIMEVLRLSQMGKKASHISIATGLKENELHYVIDLAYKFEKKSGFKLKAFIARHSWFKFAEHYLISNIQTQVGNETMLLLLNKYNPNYQTLFFDDVHELRGWLSLVKLVAKGEELKLSVSKEHPKYKSEKDLEQLKSNLGISSASFLAKTVYVRSEEYQKTPGLSVVLVGECEAHRTYTLNSIFMRYIFSACVLRAFNKRKMS